MANEITFSASLSVFKPAVMTAAWGRAVTGLLFTQTSNGTVENAGFSVAITATAIPLGGITAPHWAYFRNLDATNFVKIRNGAAGADLIKLLAGECAFVPLLDTATPYAIADTAPVLIEYMIASL